MSYARFVEDSQFYAFTDFKSELLQIFFSKKIMSHTCGVMINREEVKQLKTICEKYLEDN